MLWHRSQSLHKYERTVCARVLEICIQAWKKPTPAWSELCLEVSGEHARETNHDWMHGKHG